jgi:hypothetical protein
MQVLSRFTPSFAISIVALVAALGGTAVAAQEIAQPDDKVMHVRSDGKGGLVGNGNDGTAEKVGVGEYVVRFPSILPGPRGELPIMDCAITGTARSNPNPVNTTTITVNPIPADFNAVRVYTSKPHHDKIGEFKRQDMSFDVVAAC